MSTVDPDSKFLQNVESDKQKFIASGGYDQLVSKLARRREIVDNEKEQLGDVRALGKLTTDRRAARKVARNKDTVRNLLNSIKTKPRFQKLVQYSVECLKNLAIDEVSIEEMIDEGALETLMNIAKLNPYNEDIMKAVNQALSAFAINDYLATMIMDKMGGEQLVFSLRKHVQPETLVATCEAVSKLMTNEANVDKFVDSGVIDGLATVLKSNPENPDVLSAAAKACSRIAEYPKHAEALLNSGCVEHIMNAMRNNPDDLNLARIGAAFLEKMATCGNPKVVQALRDMGAVDLLVQVLEANPNDEELTNIGGRALGILAGEQDIGSALNMITTGNNAAAASAMGKVASLALVDENISYIIKNGGIGMIVAAVKQASTESTPASQKIIESGCRAIMRLATTEQNIYEIMKEGGVKMCVG